MNTWLFPILRLAIVISIPLASFAENTPLEGFESQAFSITFRQDTKLEASNVFGNLVGDSQIILDRYLAFSNTLERCTLSAPNQEPIIIPLGAVLKLSGPFSEHISVPFPYFLVEGLPTGNLTLRCSIINKTSKNLEWATQLPSYILESNKIKVDKN